MKWRLIQKFERIFGHKAFWLIARKFNRWIDLTEYYGCRKKIDFKSEERAEQSAQKMNESGKARNELEHYQCQYCNGWHLGRKKRDMNDGQGYKETKRIKVKYKVYLLYDEDTHGGGLHRRCQIL